MSGLFRGQHHIYCTGNPGYQNQVTKGNPGYKDVTWVTANCPIRCTGTHVKNKY